MNIKLLGMVATVAGGVISVASSILDKKNQDAAIAEKVAEAVAKAMDNKN